MKDLFFLLIEDLQVLRYELADRHGLEALLLEFGQQVRQRLPGVGGVVVIKHDGAALHLAENSVLDGGHVQALPVQAINLGYESKNKTELFRHLPDDCDLVVVLDGDLLDVFLADHLALLNVS